MFYGYILQGHEPVLEEDLLEWARWFEAADRRVALTEVGLVRVSTVFLGVDHSFGRGAPVLFETMAFGDPAYVELIQRSVREEISGLTRRYSTWAEAEKGHAAVVAEVMALIPDWEGSENERS